MKQRVRLFLALSVSVFVVLGCAPSDSGAAPASSPTQVAKAASAKPAAPAAPAAPEAKPAPAAKPVQPGAPQGQKAGAAPKAPAVAYGQVTCDKRTFGAELLSNPSFEDAKESGLAGWILCEPIEKEWKDVKGEAVSKEVPDGKSAISLPKTQDKYVMLMQELPKEVVAQGGVFHFRVMVKSAVADQVHVVLSYKKKGKEIAARAVHPGTGQWVALEKCLSIPKEAEPGSLVFRVFRRDKADGEVLVDAASVQRAEG